MLRTIISRTLAAVSLFVALGLPAFSQQAVTPQQFESHQVATWEPKFEFDDELYPSFVLTMSGRTFKAPANARYYGDAMGMAEVLIRPAVSGAQVHVEIQIEGVTGVTQPS